MKKAAATRLNILQKAFELIYKKGYQTTSIDDIIATTQVTKGAFYYHFKNKDQMGVAIINELLKPALTHSFAAPLQSEEDPLKAIHNLMHHLLMENDFLTIEHGCPAANLTFEMTPWNEDFSKALNEISQEWTDMICAALENGKENGFVGKHVNAKEATLFIMSGYWGVRNFAKLENSNESYLTYLQGLNTYLEALR